MVACRSSPTIADAMPLSPTELRARLPELTLRDERRLGRRLDAARDRRSPAARDAALAALAAEVEAAELRMARRIGERPKTACGRSERNPSPPCSRRRSHVRSAAVAVCLCFGGAVLSASRIASMTGTRGPSFGRSGALDRT